MISHSAFQKRRQLLLQGLNSNALALIASAEDVLRNGDTHFPFRQNSDFLYFTGFNETNAILVLFRGQSILFCEEPNPLTTIWTGPVLGPDKAKQVMGFDEAYPISQFESIFFELLAEVSEIHYPFLQAGQWERRLFSAWKKQRQMPKQDKFKSSSFHDLSPKLAKMRLIKSEDEILAMQQAIDMSVRAHHEVMHGIHRCDYEYQAAAIFHHALQMQGCMSVSYPSIVASGPNACVLHYTQSNRRFADQDLLLIDAGGEHLGYAADITRTYPVRGHWTPCQQAIYELVLTAQEEAIAILKPGIAWAEIQTRIVTTISQGLIDLGILNGSLDEVLEQQLYRHFYMHNSGHWLGLDVHDVGSYVVDGRSITLEPNMVLTVEPGIYISPNAEGVDEKWRGIGVRIEDDVLMTPSGHRVMSGALAKSIQDLKDILTNASA
jgi:Xaa-Pro aminopeptidase